MSTLVLPPPSSHHHHHHHHSQRPQATTTTTTAAAAKSPSALPHAERQQANPASTSKTNSSRFIQSLGSSSPHHDKRASAKEQRNFLLGYYVHLLSFANKACHQYNRRRGYLPLRHHLYTVDWVFFSSLLLSSPCNETSSRNERGG